MYRSRSCGTKTSGNALSIHASNQCLAALHENVCVVAHLDRSLAIAYVPNDDCPKYRPWRVPAESAMDRAWDPSGRAPAKLISLKLAQLAGEPSKDRRH
jgi:hypothetical protein